MFDTVKNSLGSNWPQRTPTLNVVKLTGKVTGGLNIWSILSSIFIAVKSVWCAAAGIAARLGSLIFWKILTLNWRSAKFLLKFWFMSYTTRFLLPADIIVTHLKVPFRGGDHHVSKVIFMTTLKAERFCVVIGNICYCWVKRRMKFIHFWFFSFCLSFFFLSVEQSVDLITNVTALSDLSDEMW